MKLSMLFGAAIGYVLGAKAGRERYDEIVAAARRFAGSQTVQTTAGVLQAQLDMAAQRARQSLIGKLHVYVQPNGRPHAHSANGSSRR